MNEPGDPVTAPHLENVADLYPLTPMQQGMLFHALTDPAGSVFVNQMSIQLHGPVAERELRNATERLIARHPALRSAFVWDGLEQPLQVVREQVAVEWASHDWSGLSDADQNRMLEKFLEEDRQRGIDLAAAPLTRLALIRMGDESWLWVWTTHHLIADGWSMRVMLSELFSDLRGEVDMVAEPPPFRDFVAHLTGRDSSADEEFWRSRLSGFTSPHRLQLPGLPTTGGGHGSSSIQLDPAASESLRSFAREQRVTLNTVLLGAWAIVLSRWMRTDDVVFGVTTSGRDARLRGIEDAVGLFINTLPARVAVPSDQAVGTWLQSLQRRQLESRPFELSSLAAVQRWSDVAPGDPLFESIFVFENLPAASGQLAADDVVMGEVDFVEHSNYPLAVLAHPEDDRIEITFIHDRSRLSAAAVSALGSQLVALLHQLPAHAAMPLATLELTTPDDRRQLAGWGSGTNAVGDERLIHEIIGEVAARSPDAVAAIFEQEQITYGGLWEAARNVAARLQACGVGTNDLVGLFLPRSIDMLAGMLGILQAGAAYVPLDPSYPAAHVAMLLESDPIHTVVTSAGLLPQLPDGPRTVLVDDESPSPPLQPVATRPDDYAYVIYTRGSTGRPKGVTVTHRNLVNSTMARSAHYDGPVQRFLLLSSFAFDSSVVGLFWTLCTGGGLVLPGRDREHDASHLLALARAHRVTHLLCLPSLYRVLLDHDEANSFRDLRVAIVAGEACPSGLLDVHRDQVPTTELHNEYGPTEATVWCTVHRATESDGAGPLPIGRPIAGSRIYLLDAAGKQVPPGFVGEIAVAGNGLTPGYLNRPDLTAEKFVALPLDGSPERVYLTGDLGCFDETGRLLFLGRADAQLKIRGHRIEPSAVETALEAHPLVERAAVAGRSGRNGLLLAAFVSAASFPLDDEQLRADLRNRLPRFMVPDVVVSLDSIPSLPNGKTDYSRLPELAAPAAVTEYVAPRDEVEMRMATLWADLLGVDVAEVGVEADYFALGGDSLLAIRLISAVHKKFGTSLPLSALLDAPRLGDFCRLLRAPAVRSDLIVPMRGEGTVTVFVLHHAGGNVLLYEPVARHLPGIRVLGIQAHGIDGGGEPDETVEAMASRYAAAIDKFMPTGPVHLIGPSTGGLFAFETARVLTAMGRRVGLLAMLDTLYPLGRSLPERIARQVRTVRTGRWVGVRTVTYWWWYTLRSFAGRLRHGSRWRYLLSRGRRLPPLLAGKRINHIAMHAQRVYEPRHYPGVVTYLLASGDEGYRVQDSARLWESVADQVVVRSVPGRHFGDDSMVTEPHVAVTAGVLAAELGISLPPS